MSNKSYLQTTVLQYNLHLALSVEFLELMMFHQNKTQGQYN